MKQRVIALILLVNFAGLLLGSALSLSHSDSVDNCQEFAHIHRAFPWASRGSLAYQAASADHGTAPHDCHASQLLSSVVWNPRSVTVQAPALPQKESHARLLATRDSSPRPDLDPFRRPPREIA